jgi:hypothetical protein
LNRLANGLLTVGMGASILFGVGTILSIAGPSKTVLVAVGVGVLAVVPGLLGIWLVDRGVRGRYEARIKEAHAAEHVAPIVGRLTSISDKEADSAIRVQVVPAFSEIGVDRTRQAFRKLISDLDLPESEQQTLRTFLDKTAEDSQLGDQQKIEQMVFRFAPSGPWRSPKVARDSDPSQSA